MTESDESDPADVFGLVADETRMAILRAFAEAPYEEYGGELTFSELRDRVGVSDSSQFNYHLDKLVGTFVRRTEARYELSYAGGLLYRTVVAGFFTDEPSVEDVEPESRCLSCGSRLETRYEDTRFRVECPECGREYQDVPYPPAAVETWDDEELLRAFDQWSRHDVLLFNRGICKWCGGPMPGEFERVDREGLTGDRESSVYVARNCENCDGFMYTTPGENVLYHPAVVSFFYERGVDATTTPLWELPFVSSGENVDVRATDRGNSP